MNIQDYISDHKHNLLEMYKAYAFAVLEGPHSGKVRTISEIKGHLLWIESRINVKNTSYNEALKNIIEILKSGESDREVGRRYNRISAKLAALVFCSENIANQIAINEEIEKYERRLASDRPAWRPNTSVSTYGESYLAELKAFVEFSKNQQDSD